MNLDVTIKQIEDNKNLQKLIALPFQKLNELKKNYYDWYKSAKEGYTESAQVNNLLFRMIHQAIEIKRGNEEKTWDYLT